MSVRLTLAEAEALALRVLEAAEVSAEAAAAVGRALVAAEADGLASHGLARLPAYTDQVRAGKVDGRAVPVLTETAAATLRVDARDGFAFPAIARGLARGAEMATRAGSVVVGVTNSHHFGVAGYHIEPLAERGLFALALGNSPAAIAPWGGNRGLFGTNPVACACPRQDRPPLVVDLSLSRVARGRIMVAAQKGEPIPAGWALDRDGRPTTDARAALAGTMLPIGEAKGAALALIVELLAAALTGAHFGYEASSFFDAEGPPPRVGQLFLVIDPARLAGPGFVARVEALLAAILAQPGTRLPGERRLERRAEARAGGIVLPDPLHADLLRRAGGSGTR